MTNLENLFPRDGSAGDPLRQSLSRYELENEVVCGPGLLEPVDRRDVRVVERGEDLRFSLESGESFFVSSELVGKDLDRYVAPELSISCPIDFAHPAFADGLDDLVVGELVTG